MHTTAGGIWFAFELRKAPHPLDVELPLPSPAAAAAPPGGAASAARQLLLTVCAAGRLNVDQRARAALGAIQLKALNWSRRKMPPQSRGQQLGRKLDCQQVHILATPSACVPQRTRADRHVMLANEHEVISTMSKQQSVLCACGASSLCRRVYSGLSQADRCSEAQVHACRHEATVQVPVEGH